MHFLHNTRYKYRPTVGKGSSQYARSLFLPLYDTINPSYTCSVANHQPIFAILFAKIPIISVKSLSLQNKIRIIRIQRWVIEYGKKDDELGASLLFQFFSFSLLTLRFLDIKSLSSSLKGNYLIISIYILILYIIYNI